MHSSDKLTLAESLGVSTRDRSRRGYRARERRGYVASDVDDTYSASYASRRRSGHGRDVSSMLSDPASLRFTCVGNPSQDTAYGSAPGEEPGPISSISYRLGYTHALQGGNVSLQLYRQIQAGVLLPVWVNGSALLAARLACRSATSNRSQQIYDSRGRVQSQVGNAVRRAAAVFFNADRGVKRIYQGAELTGYVTFGSLVVQPYYNLTESAAYSNSPYFTNPYAITSQAISSLTSRCSEAASSSITRRRIRCSSGSSTLNTRPQQSQQPARLYDFRRRRHAALGRGTLTLRPVTSRTPTAAIFASPANAVAYQTYSGVNDSDDRASVDTAIVLGDVRHQVRAGRRVVADGLGLQSASRRARRRPLRERPAAADGGDGGRGLSPLPTSPPTIRSRSAPMRNAAAPTRWPRRRRSPAELKTYVARIEAAKTAAGYPAAMPSPAFADAAVTYHGLGSDLRADDRVKGAAGMRSVAGCLRCTSRVATT